MTEAKREEWRAWCEQMLAIDRIYKERQWYVKKDVMFAKAMLDLLDTVEELRGDPEVKWM